MLRKKFFGNLFYRTVALALSVLLTGLNVPISFAQATPTAPRLLITIIDGDDALNNIKQRTAREPIIQVEDENHKPIAGAAVLFLLPDSGPGGVFLNGAKLLSTTTDASGRAVAQGLTPNHIAGKFDIRVKVNYNGQSAETTIHQQNVSSSSAAPSHPVHLLPVKGILIGVGIAAAGGLLAGLLVSNSGSSSTTITAGPPSVGPPTTGVSRRP